MRPAASSLLIRLVQSSLGQTVRPSSWIATSPAAPRNDGSRRRAGNGPDHGIQPRTVIASETSLQPRAKRGGRRSSAAASFQSAACFGTTLASARAIVMLQTVELDCRVGFASSQ